MPTSGWFSDAEAVGAMYKLIPDRLTVEYRQWQTFPPPLHRNGCVIRSHSLRRLVPCNGAHEDPHGGNASAQHDVDPLAN